MWGLLENVTITILTTIIFITMVIRRTMHLSHFLFWFTGKHVNTKQHIVWNKKLRDERKQWDLIYLLYFVSHGKKSCKKVDSTSIQIYPGFGSLSLWATLWSCHSEIYACLLDSSLCRLWFFLLFCCLALYMVNVSILFINSNILISVKDSYKYKFQSVEKKLLKAFWLIFKELYHVR